MHPVQFTSSVLAHLAGWFAPAGGAVAAIVALTLLARLALHPLTRAAVRGERARLRLAPKVAELRRRHSRDATRLGTELTALYRSERVSPFAGLLPLLVQAPVFLVLFAAFRDAHGPLAGARVLGVPLSTHALAAFTPAHLLVYGVLFTAVAALAWYNSRRVAMLTRVGAVPAPGGPDPGRIVASLGRVLPYALLISAAVLPLAAVVYLVTTTAWSAAENAALRRGLE